MPAGFKNKKSKTKASFTPSVNSFDITTKFQEFNKIGSAIRQHWGIENSVHWTLDVTFNEDECQIRSLHSPQNNAKVTSHCP